MLAWVLFAILVILFGALIIFNKSSFLAPEAIYVLGFLVAAFVAALYQSRWGYTLSPKTFAVLLAGILTFVIVSLLTARFFMRAKQNASHHSGGAHMFVRPAFSPTLVLYIIIAAVATIWTFAFVSSLYPDMSISAAYAEFNNVRKHVDRSVSYPSILNQLRNLCTIGGYFIAFLAARHILTIRSQGWRITGYYEPHILMFLAFVSCLIYTFLAAGRTNGLCTVAIFLFSMVLISETTEGKPFRPSIKLLLLFIAIACCLPFLFRLLAIGRTIKTTPLDYFAIYFGGDIHNLNHFLEANPEHAISLWGGMTFANSYGFLGSRLGISEWVYTLDHPMLGANGLASGNVYTMFYAPYYDFGFAGVPILTAILAFFVAWVYTKVQRCSTPKGFDFWVPLYAYICFYLFLCFFSNKGYEEILSLSKIPTLLYFLVFRFISIKPAKKLKAPLEPLRNENSSEREVAETATDTTRGRHAKKTGFPSAILPISD